MAEAWLPFLGMAGSPLQSPGLCVVPRPLCLSSLWGHVELGEWAAVFPVQ